MTDQSWATSNPFRAIHSIVNLSKHAFRKSRDKQKPQIWKTHKTATRRHLNAHEIYSKRIQIVTTFLSSLNTSWSMSEKPRASTTGTTNGPKQYAHLQRSHRQCLSDISSSSWTWTIRVWQRDTVYLFRQGSWAAHMQLSPISQASI